MQPTLAGKSGISCPEASFISQQVYYLTDRMLFARLLQFLVRDRQDVIALYSLKVVAHNL